MKRSIVFTILLVFSTATILKACGFYPYGEELRFNLLSPACFKVKGFTPFNYSADYYYYGGDDGINKEGLEISTHKNLELWQKRCKNQVVLDDVYEAVYVYSAIEEDKNSENSFVRYLSANKDVEAIKYLNFAKSCEAYNTNFSDPWERRDITSLPQRDKLMKQAMAEMKRTKDDDLKRRYAFIAIRLAYYDGDDVLDSIYEDVFAKSNNKDIIYYWSSYFYSAGTKDNFLLAQVFANAPDKRFMCCQFADRNQPMEDFLEQANSPAEKSALYLLYGVRNMSNNLDCLEKMYSNTPNYEGLDFLLLREVHKLEDWICTPYYTEFGPALYHGSSSWDRWDEKDNAVIMEKRITVDREYARKVIEFINKADMSKVYDPALWQTAKAYLLFMAGEYAATLKELESPLLASMNENGKEFVEKLKAIAHTANQKVNAAVIPELVKPILMKYSDNPKFIFAIGRELEYRNNTTDAAILFSKKNKENTDWYYSDLCWRTKLRHCTLYSDYFTDYFYYMDAQYTPQQVEMLINDIKNNKSTDAFSEWKYKRIKNNIDRLYDLLGTKYMRQDKLTDALQAFKQVTDTLWASNEFEYKYYLNANIFFTNFYNEHRPTEADTVVYNKKEMVEKIIEYTKLANDSKNSDRDYYYFLLGNAYLNMTQYGNSWMMKRYYWTSSATPTKLEDDEDYFGAVRAKEYYLKANKISKSEKFAALCLRMAGRCEGYWLGNNQMAEYIKNGYDWDKVDMKLFEENKSYNDLQDKYPDYYEELISNCESFYDFVKAR